MAETRVTNRRSQFTAKRFASALVDLGLSSPQSAFADLEREYGAPERRYHTSRHIADCLVKLDAHRALARRPAEIEIALFFHDAIYDPRRADHEERSADWAARFLAGEGLHADAVRRVRALVLATRHDAQPDDDDQKLLVDIDLSILGAAPRTFGEYDRQIAQEFAWLPVEQYRSGRAAVLREFLARPRIFATLAFFASYEARARRNLMRALSALERAPNDHGDVDDGR